jgi:hypothetical protein
VTRSRLGILIVTGSWTAVSIAAMTAATTTAVVVFLAVTIASLAIGRELIERREH